MSDIGMTKGGACLVSQTRRRVVVDVVDHMGNIVSGSTEEKREKK